MLGNLSNPRVLLVGDSAELDTIVREALGQIGRDAFEYACAATLAQGVEMLSKRDIDAVLALLALPDSRGIATLDALHRAAPHVPILVLGDEPDPALFRQVLKSGGQDYLINAQVSSYLLARALNGAIGRKAAEDALFLERERAQVTLDSIGDAVLSTDVHGVVTYLNRAAEDMTGWSRRQACGQRLDTVFHIIDGGTRLAVPDPTRLAIEGDVVGTLSANSVLIRRDGVELAVEDSVAPIHDRLGAVTGAVIVFHDVSASRSLEVRMAHLAQHDFLTDLPNRVLLGDRLVRAIGLARRHGRSLAVLFLDLDHLKHINDSLGHPVGDALLKELARRILGCVRGSDTVSRQGGDEFVVLLSEIESADNVAAIADKIRLAVVAPYLVGEHELQVSVSIGVSVFPADGGDGDSLIRNADTAMYHAKASGRDNCQFFSPAMNVRAVERQSIEEGLRRALERSEFVLDYQAKVDLRNGRITGAEALVRWQHPTRGLTLPAAFIAVAEESGLIVPIGHWVLREACRQARAWIDAGLPFEQIAVNISALEFASPGFLDKVTAILAETRLDPRCLELELTETVLMRTIEATSCVLRSLSTLGIRLALDDFGTGYSSLSYLKRFPIDTLKIDQSFVHDVTTDEGDAAIVTAVVAIGRSLKQRVVAEGIENREQLAFLRRQGCSEGQGYFFSVPLGSEAFAGLLVSGIPWDLQDGQGPGPAPQTSPQSDETRSRR